MRVFGLNLGGEPLTTPYPSKSGFIFRLLGGDVIYPLGNGDWFRPPYFDRVIRFFMPIPIMPFLSIRLGRFGFYFGCKVFGVDSPAYANWMCDRSQVYPGSQSMMLISIRFTRALG